MKVKKYFMFLIGFVFVFGLSYLFVSFDNKRNVDVSSEESEFMDNLQKNDPYAYEVIHEFVSETDFNSCLPQLSERLKRKNIKVENSSTKWKVTIGLESKDGFFHVKKFSLANGSNWPTYFDDEAKKCYEDLMFNYQVASESNFDYEYTTEFCVL